MHCMLFACRYFRNICEYVLQDVYRIIIHSVDYIYAVCVLADRLVILAKIPVYAQ